MTNGSQSICAAEVYPTFAFHVWGGSAFVRDNVLMADSVFNPQVDWRHARLRKHADYQRVYKVSRKQFSSSMSYFFRIRAEDELRPPYNGPRIGLTAGRVLGKAVERNRIKRRLREATRENLALLPQFADVVLHPRRSILDIEFAKLKREVGRIFSSVRAQTNEKETQG
jgi:ribonuclease P protein component